MAALSILAACSADDSGRGPGGTTPVPTGAMTAVQVPQSFSNAITVSDGELSIPTKENEDTLSKITVGTVIVGQPSDSNGAQNPDGFLVKVVAITTEGGNTTLETDEASLEDLVVEGGSLSVDIGGAGTGIKPASLHPQNKYTSIVGDFVAPGPITTPFEDGSITWSNVHATGSTYYHLGAGVKTNGAFEYVKVAGGSEYETTADIQVSIDAGGTTTTVDEDLYEAVVSRGSIDVGSYQVPYAITMRIHGECALDAEAATIKGHLHAFGSKPVAVEMENGHWIDSSDPGTPGQVDAPAASVTGTVHSASCEVSTQFHVEFAGGSEGPTFHASPGLEVHSNAVSSNVGFEFAGHGSVIGSSLPYIPRTPPRSGAAFDNERNQYAQKGGRPKRRASDAALFAEYDRMNQEVLSVSDTVGNSLDLANASAPRTPKIASYDWTNYGRVTPATRNQGQCGSCWAFATTAVAEGAWLRVRGDASTFNLSEQDILACGTTPGGYDLGGCGGSYTGSAMNFLSRIGQRAEPDNRYNGLKPTQGQNTCGNSDHFFQVSHYGVLKGTTVDWFGTQLDYKASVFAIKHALLEHGPVTTSVNVGHRFDHWYNKSRVYSQRKPPSKAGWHAMAIVGWDDRRYAWRIKNQWGPEFGDNGFMWMRYDAAGVGTQVVWASVNN